MEQCRENKAAIVTGASSGIGAAISARPKGTAQPADVPVMSFPSVTAGAQTMWALPIWPSQPG